MYLGENNCPSSSLKGQSRHFGRTNCTSVDATSSWRWTDTGNPCPKPSLKKSQMACLSSCSLPRAITRTQQLPEIPPLWNACPWKASTALSFHSRIFSSCPPEMRTAADVSPCHITVKKRPCFLWSQTLFYLDKCSPELEWDLPCRRIECGLKKKNKTPHMYLLPAVGLHCPQQWHIRYVLCPLTQCRRQIQESHKWQSSITGLAIFTEELTYFLYFGDKWVLFNKCSQYPVLTSQCHNITDDW